MKTSYVVTVYNYKPWRAKVRRTFDVADEAAIYYNKKLREQSTLGICLEIIETRIVKQSGGTDYDRIRREEKGE